MGWHGQLTQIEADLRSNSTLLSSALLRTATALRNAASEDLLLWLNKEIVGYEQFELEWFAKSKYSYLVSPRNVSCVEGLQLNGVFVEKSFANVTLGCGISELEDFLNRFFDISVLESGNEELLKSVICGSSCRVCHLLTNAPGSDVVYAIKGIGFLDAYCGVRTALLEMIGAFKRMCSGAELIRAKRSA